MQYANLGTTGLEVSRICLGCMTYGDPARGSHMQNHQNLLYREEEREMLPLCLPRGSA